MCKKIFLDRVDDLEFLLFKPSLFRLYDNCYSRNNTPPYINRIIHRVRMIRELFLSHYQVIYMRKDGDIIGHLVVGRGGSRIAQSDQKDIVIGPIWVIPSERSCGYASKGIRYILQAYKGAYRYAYEYIEKDNLASIRTVEKNGFEFVSECNEYGVLKRIKACSGGHLVVYRKGA